MIEKRKTVTVVFADLVESTSLAERIDPEVLAGLLRRYFSVLRSAVEAHGGRVEKFIGDAVVGVFGLPVLHEDDALRAVRAALAMGTALSELNAELRPTLGVELAIRVGVNTGEVIASADNALGHPISMAARLEQNAQPGEVLIGERTHVLAAEAIVAERVADLAVKGSTEPLAAWRVKELRSLEPRGSHSAGPYVGRERELALLKAAFEQSVAAPACVTVTVVAPPGLGKSRLITEAVGQLSGQARVLIGRCLPYGEGITYAPLVDMVRALEADEDADAVTRLMEGQPEAEQVIARIRATVSGATSGSPDETAWAFRRLFEALAAHQPLVAVFDDIHWADPALLDLIEYVGTFSMSSPVVLLCAARPDLFDSRPAWSAPRDNAQQIRLAPLSAQEALGLLAEVDGRALDEATRQRIVESAGGVPLFIEQMAAYDADLAGHGIVPPSIKALLSARVDRLAPEDRAVLEHAAVPGTAFRRDALAELMPADERATLGTRLMALVRRDFIRVEAGRDGHDNFGFSHALVRDAVYDAMPRRTRAELHERYAAILERRDAAAADVIAYHLEQAYRERLALGEGGPHMSALAQRAGQLLTRAGRQATARKQASRAVDLLTRAADLLEPSARLAVLPDLIDALAAVPDIDAARRVHTEAVVQARAANDETSELRAELALAALEPDSAQPEWKASRDALLDRAVPFFEAAGDEDSIARALLLKALALNLTDRTGGVEILKLAQLHAQRTDDERIQVEVWDELGGMMLFGPTPYAEVLEVTRAEVEWARQHGNAFAAADGRLGEAYALAALGQFDDARALLDELIELFSQLPGRVAQHGEAYALAGRIERDRSHPATALEMYRHAQDVFARSGYHRWWRNAVSGVAHALIDLGRLDEARQALDEMAAQHSDTDGPSGAFQLEAQARYLVRTGRAPRALELANQAVAGLVDTGSPFYEGRSRETRAEVLLAMGEAEGARRELRLARELYEQKGYLPGIARIDRQLADEP